MSLGILGKAHREERRFPPEEIGKIPIHDLRYAGNLRKIDNGRGCLQMQRGRRA